MKMHPISNFAMNDLPMLPNENDPCVCTSYKRVDDETDRQNEPESSSFHTPSVASSSSSTASYDNADNANIIFPSRQLLDFSK